LIEIRNCSQINSYKILLKSGKLILTFRDLAFELKEEQRFIPIKSDDNRIFICFLEYNSTYVKVFDIIYEKENGRWSQKISSYKKLVISRNVVEDYFEGAGFKIESTGIENGLVTIIGAK
jgi:hypothetical protein